MRWLFLLLLVLNVAYVGWKLSMDAATDAAVASQFEGVDPILLLSELETANAVGEQIKIAKTPPVSVEPDAKPAISSEKPPGISPDKSPDKSPERPAEKAPEPQQVAVAPLPDQCFTLGPFRELKRLSAFTRDIKNYVVEVSFKARDEDEQSMYWVYLDPVGSLDKATRLSEQLKRGGVNDHYVIKSGDKNTGISLGHFKEKERAYKHAWEIKAKGFEPSVEPVFKSFTIYWLDYRVQQGRVIPEAVLKKHLTQKLSRLDRPCK